MRHHLRQFQCRSGSSEVNHSLLCNPSSALTDDCLMINSFLCLLPFIFLTAETAGLSAGAVLGMIVIVIAVVGVVCFSLR